MSGTRGVGLRLCSGLLSKGVQSGVWVSTAGEVWGGGGGGDNPPEQVLATLQLLMQPVPGHRVHNLPSRLGMI